jgi:hypothetical protein
MGFRHPLTEPAGSFAYVECSIPAGMTISTYRRSRARRGGRRRFRRLVLRGVRSGC